jgi:hypothetical protein
MRNQRSLRMQQAARGVREVREQAQLTHRAASLPAAMDEESSLVDDAQVQ